MDRPVARDVRLIRSPISVTGMVLTTVSAVLFLVVFFADLLGLHTNPYIGIVFFLILPAIFLLGLGLIPLGAWHERRRRVAGKPPAEVEWPRIDFGDPVQRQRAVLIFALTMANIVIVSLAAYRGVEYMDSVQFCGQVCHTAMKPEFAAYQDGPHSRVRCVACHTGPGATAFAKSKVSGTRRVMAVAFGTYSRPIPSPARDMRPARETCERCHWPEKFHGDKIRRITEFSDDERNTESVTTLRVHVGGGSDRLGIATGIHWHMNVANEIEYVATDRANQTIPYVRLKDRSGRVREYVVEGFTADELATGERRRMDCMDCHNRPSHVIAPTAERAVNEAMARGEIPRTLPFVRREAVRLLTMRYPSQEAAFEAISTELHGFYQAHDPPLDESRRADVDRAVRGTQAVYGRNVFPEMAVGFGTYPNNIGHTDAPGCFRCHDDNHKTRDGRTIGQDCESCHDIDG
jgi:hypothetical protein